MFHSLSGYDTDLFIKKLGKSLIILNNIIIIIIIIIMKLKS